MYPLYITEQGAVLKKSGGRLLVAKNGKTLMECPVFKLSRVVLIGNIQLTCQAVALLLENGIDVHYLSFGGKIRGSLSSSDSCNVYLKLAQYDRFKDEVFKLAISKAIVGTKLRNQKAILKRYQRNHSEVDFRKELAVIDNMINVVEDKTTVDESRGCEGAGAGAYFKAFGQMLRRDISFKTRKKHPSPDPVNSLLSFGYSLVTSDLISLLTATSLDPMFGFLHGIRYGRNSLALDMVEEFRQPLIDRFTLYLFNNNIIKSDDFEQQPNGGLYLKSDTLKKYLQLFYGRMKHEVEDNGNRYLWSDLMKLQVSRMKDAILKNTEYKPFVFEG